MMYQEFEELAGYEVTYKDYSEIIEPMYMALNVSKQDFIQMLDRKRFALPTKKEMIREMKKLATHLYETCGRYTDFESKDKLEELSRQYARRFYNLDLSCEGQGYCYFLQGYEFEEIQKGCTYPKTLVVGRGNSEYERVQLVKGVA